MAIRNIACCCGGGMGTSLMIKINVEKTLKKIGVSGVSVEFASISDAAITKSDLYVVSKELALEVSSLPNVMLLENIMDEKEMEEKFRKAFNV
jgi:PTS system ascorbate-specific IIB component